METIRDKARGDNEYPNSINPNANPSATLALERAKMAMALAGEPGEEAEKLRNALLDWGEPELPAEDEPEQ